MLNQVLPDMIACQYKAIFRRPGWGMGDFSLKMGLPDHHKVYHLLQSLYNAPAEVKVAQDATPPAQERGRHQTTT